MLVLTEQRELEAERPFDNVRVVPRGSRNILARLLLRAMRSVAAAPSERLARDLQASGFRGALQEFGADVILANYGHGGVAVAAVAHSIGVPLVVSFHGADASRRARNPHWQEKYRAMFDVAAAVTGPSDYVCEKLAGLGCPRERIHKLHYGIRTDRIRFRPRTLDDGQPVRFLFVGRLSAKKDPLTLLRSFARAREELPDGQAVLTIVGDGPLRQDVADMVRQLRLDDAVELLGHRTHQQVIEHYDAAHIYVQHSVTAPDGDEEGLPVSITEALAAGLPVISTRHSGIPEAVRHDENGYLVTEGDDTAMARYMVELARDRERWPRFGRAGRRLLEDEFSMPIVQRQLRGLLSDVSGKPF